MSPAGIRTAFRLSESAHRSCRAGQPQRRSGGFSQSSAAILPLHHVKGMTEQFQRLGVIGDWEHPYITLNPEFEAKQIEVFGEMALKGLYL